MTYSEYLTNSKKFAKGLSLIEIEAKDSIGIMGHNSPAWSISQLGSILYGKKFVGIYGTSNSDQCNYISSHSNIKVLVVDKKNKISKFTNGILKVVIVYDDIMSDDDFVFYKEHYDIRIFTWKQFMLLSDFSEWKIEKPEFYKNKIVTLIYTSGTTGNPKAVPLSHRNIISSVNNTFQGIKTKIVFNVTKERFISYLPLNHIAAQMLDLYMPVVLGGTVYFADSNALKSSLLDTLISVRPTIFMGVPRIWEKVKSNIESHLPINTNNKTILYAISGMVTNKIGLNECKMRITGAAPIDKDVLQYFKDLEIPLTDIYGMSETTGALTMSDNIKNGPGKVLPLTKVKILKNKKDKFGEIIVSGPNVFYGYYNNEIDTEKSFYGSWFKTGDLGYLDNQNYLHIIGRNKELIITKGGENIAPVPIEQTFKKYVKGIENVIVIGDKRKYLTALIDIGKNKISTEQIDSVLDVINSHAASNAHTVKKYKIISGIFSHEGGELTNTLKLKRNFIEAKYNKEIEDMY